jgi:flagellar assembly protein FliH
MTDPRPYNFDNDFGDALRSTPAPQRRKRVYLAEEVDAIRTAAYNDGEASITALAKVAEAQALTAIAEAARVGLSALAEVAHEHRCASAELALAAARKIAGAALDRFPAAPVRAALETLGREIESQPRLVVRMADPPQSVKTGIENAARDAGFTGQIVFRAEPGLPVAAFILEWNDGRAAFDPEAVIERVAQSFEAALAADGVHGDHLNLPERPTGA